MDNIVKLIGYWQVLDNNNNIRLNDFTKVKIIPNDNHIRRYDLFYYINNRGNLYDINDELINDSKCFTQICQYFVLDDKGDVYIVGRVKRILDINNIIQMVHNGKYTYFLLNGNGKIQYFEFIPDNFDFNNEEIFFEPKILELNNIIDISCVDKQNIIALDYYKQIHIIAFCNHDVPPEIFTFPFSH